ncbi:hypothetical protein BOTBODRAFT_169497 [Botryobasidium botryosum FD-172 SS1]|uniref:Uncharacterized protein n=1 Tax=Botryobasidium botryosum (strain FD-172 SS1) TaxID=930990 RepID=A0A067N9J4_BOTB1|nr:hypothetical protein BOTBODRAFT_169497 [Botryobasidium botryosum FD-172 SS1]
MLYIDQPVGTASPQGFSYGKQMVFTSEDAAKGVYQLLCSLRTDTLVQYPEIASYALGIIFEFCHLCVTAVTSTTRLDGSTTQRYVNHHQNQRSRWIKACYKNDDAATRTRAKGARDDLAIYQLFVRRSIYDVRNTSHDPYPSHPIPSHP